MKAASVKRPMPLAELPRPGRLDSLARRLVLNRFSGLRHGQLIIREGKQRLVFGDASAADSLCATLTVNDPAFYGDVAYGGSIGAGEAWMQGLWQCDDLVSLVRLMVRNRASLDDMDSGMASVTRWIQQVLHRLNRNTRRGARRNIAAHYDLGNEFFALWLDESMMYSSAIFDNDDSTLAEAQQTRLGLVCQRLNLKSHDHLLEIGTGWGGMAIYAAGHYGCQVTTTTISREQYEMARKRIDAAGLQDKITLLLEDYRDLQGSYDKLVSIEMIEAIGSAQHETFFARCQHLLRPGGRMLLQAITIADERYERYRTSVDFIQKYIFPGSCLPSERRMRNVIARVSDLQIESVEDLGLHYAKTLHHWRRNFHQALAAVRQLGYSESFVRMWDYYLCYCEGGFLERSISDVHLVANRPSEIDAVGT